MLIDELRTATRPHHEALEAEMDLLNRAWTIESYKRLLGAFYGFLAVTEPQLHQEVTGWEALGYSLDSRRKLPLLQKDLEYLGVQPGELDVATNTPSLKNAGQALGYIYVIEGSTLGGQLISRFFKDKLGVTPETGGSYFSGYGEKTGINWKETMALLDCAPGVLGEGGPGSEGAVQAAVTTAQDTFAALRLWMVPVLATVPFKGTLQTAQ